jgi:hypothetical protein
MTCAPGPPLNPDGTGHGRRQYDAVRRGACGLVRELDSSQHPRLVVFRPVSVQLGDLVVSLDAIVLTGFVLRDQLHMTIVSDRRAHRFADEPCSPSRSWRRFCKCCVAFRRMSARTRT